MKQKTIRDASKVITEHYPLVVIYDTADLRSIFEEKSKLYLTDEELWHYSQRFIQEGIGLLLLEDELVEFTEKNYEH